VIATGSNNMIEGGPMAWRTCTRHSGASAVRFAAPDPLEQARDRDLARLQTWPSPLLAMFWPCDHATWRQMTLFEISSSPRNRGR
jgi:hypothetical protein